MTYKALAALSAALIIAAAGSASAHHSTVAYDMTKSVTVRGVVKDFAPMNPHMQMSLVVSDEKGVHTLEFEGQSVSNMYRLGYRRGMINVGDTVTVTYAPLRTGMPGGFFKTVTLADGKTVGGPLTGAPG